MRRRLRTAANRILRAFDRAYNLVDRFFAWSVLGPALIVVCAVLVTGYAEDRRSCDRQVPTRQTIKQFVAYQTIFQGALSTLDPEGGPTATIVDPDTHEELKLNRAELRRWVQSKQRVLVGRLPVPDCSAIPPGQ